MVNDNSTSEVIEDEPEVAYFIGVIDGFPATAILTARTDTGKFNRTDGRGPWDPLYSEDGEPQWFRVSQKIAEEWTADEEDGF